MILLYSTELALERIAQLVAEGLAKLATAITPRDRLKHTPRGPRPRRRGPPRLAHPTSRTRSGPERAENLPADGAMDRT